MTSHDQPRRLYGINENQNPRSGYTLRKMNGFYQGQVYKMFSRLPLYKTQVNPDQIMRYKTIMDSMTDRELDELNPEQMSPARIMEIARESRQGLNQVSEMLREFKRLQKEWRNVERLMCDRKLMDMSALFWNEIATPFNIDIVPEAENIPLPRKFQLMDWVKCDFIIYGTSIFCLLAGMSIIRLGII